MPGVSIEAADVRKRLGPNQALAGLSMSFEPGLLHTLIGPNGAGKTTLLRTVLGLLRPDSGTLSFKRDGVVLDVADVRASVAYMPQRNCLYADLSIGEHLAFFAKLYALPRETYRARRDELLHLTRLDRFADRPAGLLSGGMYKKLGLMCALMMSPQVLLLDEPTNGVDPVSRRELWELLHALTIGGRVTIVMATSYLDEGERSARVHLINKGRCVAEGEAEALMRERSVTDLEEIFLREGAA